MKLTQILAAALLLAAMISCKSNPALDYSEAIVKMEKELSADIARVDQKVAEYIDAQKTDSAGIMTQQMEQLVENKLQEIRKLEVPKVKDGDNFKKEVIRYFSYLKSIYTSFHRLTIATTAEQKEIERRRLSDIVKERKEAAGAMLEAQRKFAAANDFRIGTAGDQN